MAVQLDEEIKDFIYDNDINSLWSLLNMYPEASVYAYRVAMDYNQPGLAEQIKRKIPSREYLKKVLHQQQLKRYIPFDQTASY